MFELTQGPFELNHGPFELKREKLQNMFARVPLFAFEVVVVHVSKHVFRLVGSATLFSLSRVAFQLCIASVAFGAVVFASG